MKRVRGLLRLTGVSKASVLEEGEYSTIDPLLCIVRPAK